VSWELKMFETRHAQTHTLLKHTANKTRVGKWSEIFSHVRGKARGSDFFDVRSESKDAFACFVQGVCLSSSAEPRLCGHLSGSRKPRCSVTYRKEKIKNSSLGSLCPLSLALTWSSTRQLPKSAPLPKTARCTRVVVTTNTIFPNSMGCCKGSFSFRRGPRWPPPLPSSSPLFVPLAHLLLLEVFFLQLLPLALVTSGTAIKTFSSLSLFVLASPRFRNVFFFAVKEEEASAYGHTSADPADHASWCLSVAFLCFLQSLFCGWRSQCLVSQSIAAGLDESFLGTLSPRTRNSKFPSHFAAAC